MHQKAYFRDRLFSASSVADHLRKASSFFSPTILFNLPMMPISSPSSNQTSISVRTCSEQNLKTLRTDSETILNEISIFSFAEQLVQPLANRVRKRACPFRALIVRLGNHLTLEIVINRLSDPRRASHTVDLVVANAALSLRTLFAFTDHRIRRAASKCIATA